MRLADLSLATPWALLGLVPVAGAVAWMAWRRRTHRDPAMRFPSADLVSALPTTAFAKISWLPDALRVVALALIVVALARPQLVGPPAADEAEGIDIVMVLDTSCSMLAADFQPKDRITVAKKSIQEFVLKRKSDRIGLVVFGAEAATWVPLTLDYSLIAAMLDDVEVGMLPDGTAIGTALGTALNRLRESQAKSKVVVLLTDGDSNAGSVSPRKAAELAKQLGVKVYTILVGRGGDVPFPAGKDMFGRPVMRTTRIPTNPALLEEIAATSGGQAFTASDREELDARLGEILDSLERTRIESTAQLRPYAELFPWLVLFAVGLLALELLLASTRLARFP